MITISLVDSSAFRGQIGQYELELGWLGDRQKDATDIEWKVYSDHKLNLISWLLVHFIGSRFLKNYKIKVKLELY